MEEGRRGGRKRDSEERKEVGRGTGGMLHRCRQTGKVPGSQNQNERLNNVMRVLILVIGPTQAWSRGVG